ncbi:hypothetical protein [Rubinisphaera sp.]|uniref:hypothetical protein n=1 Tax=Rubinisphaera sp. TaxID=2024857 RepID=UPI000C0D36BD|nr:hypothetical protein [Rubinisphaera sp.]MBV12036.1 hypothetical protein [Rubinisphaera sp.]|tara:strand:- start:4376 stop:4867 length:492 start_codon:yes stop_codon:yes gene_type:complete
MDLYLIIYVMIGLGCAILVAFLFFIDNAIDLLTDWFFTRIGWLSGPGPLVVVAERNGDELTLKMQNQGQAKLKLAAVEGRDLNNQRHFPKPRFAEDEHNGLPTFEEAITSFSRIVLNPQESEVVKLKRTDLLALGCTSLAIIDSNGKSWPVQGFHADELNHAR